MIVLSMVGGLPIGGKMTAEMYDKGYITKRQGQRLIMFCMNPGPAFVITTVGHYLTGSAQIGVLVFTALVISSLSVGFLTRFIYSDDDFEYKISKNTACTKISIKDAIVSSVTESGRGMLNVCAWVILFSCISEMIALLPLNEGTKTFINCILEVTNGCEYAAQSQPVPVLAGIIGFSGICAHLQIMPAITKVKLPIKYFLSARIINGSLAVVITMLLLKLFPITVQTISMGSLPERINTDISAPVCVGIMIMSVLLLLGENYRIRNKTKKTA
ncbi:MAG: hypothetical protein IJ491_05470 [Clostridia bacterium]|nr:hypothetical protein [Clostridia bacterium]